MSDNNGGCGVAILGLVVGVAMGLAIGVNVTSMAISHQLCTRLGWDGGKSSRMCYVEGNGHIEGYQCHLSLVLSGECELPEEKGE